MGWCSGETVNHFLNYCDKGIAYVLWCLVFGAFWDSVGGGSRVWVSKLVREALFRVLEVLFDYV